jgi:hypothetical protein
MCKTKHKKNTQNQGMQFRLVRSERRTKEYIVKLPQQRTET